MKRLISLLTLLSLASASAAFAQAQDDYLVAVQEQPRWIPLSELLANDSLEPIDFSITQQPDHGQLEISPDGLMYRPPAGPIGIYFSDHFTYTVVTCPGTGCSDEAQVTIRLLPRRLPVIGDFHGDAELEFGFYRPAHSDFKICPMQDVLTDADCQRFRAPQHSTGLPMIGSWNATGYDEAALYDPATGTISILGPLSQRDELSVTATLDGPINAWPVPGIHDSGFVFWIAEESSFLLIRPDASSASHAMPTPVVPTANLFEHRWRPVTQRGESRFGLANTDSGEVDWLGPRTFGNDIVTDIGSKRIHLWIQDIFETDIWASFDTLATLFLVTEPSFLNGVEGSGKGLSLLLDIPDDPF